MKKLCLGFVCVCCAYSSLFADDQQNSDQKIDVSDRPVSSQTSEPSVQSIIPELASEKRIQIIRLKSKSIRKNKVRYPRQIFLNQTGPFPRIVREATSKSQNRPSESSWQNTVPGLYPQLKPGMSQQLIYGGAMILD